MNSQSVIELLTEKITHLRIAVIGDVMLDRYAYGEVRRISPEPQFPSRVKTPDFRLGGAGNVAANLQAWGPGLYVAGMTVKTITAASREENAGARGRLQRPHCFPKTQYHYQDAYHYARQQDAAVLTSRNRGISRPTRKELFSSGSASILMRT